MVERKLKNWVQAYLTFTAESESPEEYHKWVALSAIAGAIRRQAFFDMGYFLLYPNLYTVLVGPAGRCKKSTAMRIGRVMLSGVPNINFTTDSVTRERLIQDLTQAHSADGHSSMTAYSSEFASLLTSSGMDMVVFLTDIYDCPPEWAHKTKMGGTNRIKSPYLNLMGATTPDWIAKAMPLDTVGIGLTSRIIFVYQDTPRVKPAFPVLSPEQAALKDVLIHDLSLMSQISGEYKWAPGAAAIYEEWYQGRTLNPNTSGDPRLNGYFERRPMHLIKLCMIVAASFRDDLVLTADDLQIAQGLLFQIEERMTKVFANVGKNPLAVDYDDVKAVINISPEGISKADLMRMFKHSVRLVELEEVLETLVSMNSVVLGAGPKYFPLKGATSGE